MEEKILCSVCHRETSGEMGTGEMIIGKYWWCRLCKKCPHYSCRRLRYVKDNIIVSHCGRSCLYGSCQCNIKL